MNLFLQKLRILLIFNKKKRKALRIKLKRALKISKENTLCAYREWEGSLDIQGRGNRIALKPGATALCVDICIFGNNNTVEIGENVFCLGTKIFIGTEDCDCNNSRVIIGNATTMGKNCEIRVMEHESEVALGQDVMCSDGIHIWGTDSHAIFDETGKLKNIGRNVSIGNHVWIGMDAKIGKNVSIGDESIVGWGSVVPQGVYPASSLIAGNPASVRKSNISWNGNRPASPPV